MIFFSFATSTFPRRSSSVSRKFRKFYFIRVSPPGWCHPGRSAPTSPSP